MKRTFLMLSMILCVCGFAWGQGTVNFANAAPGVNAPIWSWDPLTNCEIRLMAGGDPNNLTFIPPAARVSRAFFTNGWVNNYFTGGERTISGIPAGTSVFIRVDVWSPDWGGNIGESSVIVVTLTGPPMVPASLIGLTGFFARVLTPYFYGFNRVPADQTVFSGSVVEFSVAVSASPQPSNYQWRHDGVDIPGASNAVYTILNAQPQHAGTYSVVVSNFQWWGPKSATTTNATLTVVPAPDIALSPRMQTAEAGSAVQFRAAVSGTAPLGYQWLFGGSPMEGAAATILNLTNTQFFQAGAYSLMATNAFGAVTSAPAMLSVIPAVERRMVPALTLIGQPGIPLNLDFAAQMEPVPAWAFLDTLPLPQFPQWYFDLSAPLPAQRFYRAWQSGAPSVVPTLDVHMVPAITVTGTIGGLARLDYINQFGPIDAWQWLETIALTNTSQLYFDTSSIGQPPRLWRIKVVP